MSNKSIYPAIILSLVGCKGAQQSNRQDVVSQKPNFVFIICEDISCNLNCYGDTVARTPNLDKLAEEGMRFTNAFSVAGVCAPSRSGIITGMYPTTIGTHHMRTRIKDSILPVAEYSPVVPHQVKCFTEYLRAAGYYCTNRGKRDFQFKVPITAFDDLGLNGAHWKNCPKGKPFYSCFNIFDTHESQIWKRADKPLRFNPDSMPVPPYFPDTPEVRRDIAQNYTNIETMDRKVGELLQELREDSLLDNTFVIFISDHGGPLPRQKREIINAGLHVPLIIRFPKAEHAGSVNNNLVSFIDIAPTILSLAEIEIPEYMQGKAFIGKQKTQPRKYVFGARDRMDTKYDRVRSVRDKQFVYVRNFFPEKPWIQDIGYRENMATMQIMNQWYLDGKLNSIQQIWFEPTKSPEALYDTYSDPYEIHNLVDSASYHKKLIELRKAMDNWIDRTNDMGDIPELTMIKKMWHGLEQPVTQAPAFTVKNHKICISCSVKGASIAYQVLDINAKIPDVNEPNAWKLYTKPLEINKQQVVYAVAIRIGYKQSKLSVYKTPDV